MLGKAKQSYYKRLKTIENKTYKEELVVSLVKGKRKLWKKGSGRNLYYSLKPEFEKHKIKLGRDKFYEILRSNNLLMRRKQRRVRTTISYHRFHKYPNLIKDMEVNRPNKVILSDITYIWIEDQKCFAYLFLITDMYSRKILGYFLSEDMTTESSIKALEMALKEIKRPNGSIHHSDRGVQYCSHRYTKYLKRHKMLISMTENGDPKENAIAERLNGIIKGEFTLEKQISFRNFTEAKKEISKIIDFYNNQRPHRSIEMLSPDQAYKRQGKLKRMWKNYYPTNEKKLKEIRDLTNENVEIDTCLESY